MAKPNPDHGLSVFFQFPRGLVLIGALALSLTSAASPQSQAVGIRDFGALLTIQSDGSLDVTEELTARFAGDSNEIVRDLSLRRSSAAADATKLDLTVLAITDEAGQSLRVEEETTDKGWTRRLRIWIPGPADVDHQISIRYRVANAFRFVNGGNSVGALNELRWNVTGDDWAMPIDSVHARIVLPAGVKPTRTAAYNGPSGSIATDVTTGTSGNQVSFELSRALLPHEGMTIGVSWPFGYLHPKRTTPARERFALLLWWPLLIPAVVFRFAYRAWEKTGRDPEEKSDVVSYEPVDGASPAELGRLLNDEARPPMRLISSTLVDLAVRGFLRIEETPDSNLLTRDVRDIAQSLVHGQSGSTDYIIHFARKRSECTGLKWHEEHLLDGLITAAPSDGMTKRDSVRVSALRNKFYISVRGIFEALDYELVFRGYYRKSPSSVRKRWVFYATFPLYGGALLQLLMNWARVPYERDALFAGSIFSVLVLLYFSQYMSARTIAGARAREAAHGFKEFLGRVEVERYKKMITSPEMFERYLSYAIAFGVETTWAGAFEGIYRTPPDWYSGGTGTFSASAFGYQISDMSFSAANTMSSMPPSTRGGLSSSGSGSGGGGSSGGGSGGGGGSGF